MTVEAKFREEKIIPDVIDSLHGPILAVSFHKNQVTLGNELTPTQVKDVPCVTIDAEHFAFYTLIFTDPDTPSRAKPTTREFLHWLIVNIPGYEISHGEVLAEYVSSEPPKHSGLHRYTFLIFKQPKRLVFGEKKIPNDVKEGRTQFSTRKFAEKYNLGSPISGNYYVAQYDENAKRFKK